MILIFKTIIIVFFLNTLLFSQESLVSRTLVQMGTFVTLFTLKKDENQIQKGFDILHKIEMSLSSYNQNALVYKLNHDKQITLDDTLFEALQESSRYYQETNGYFDITIGSITKDLYRFGEEQRVPYIKELKSAKVDFHGLHFDRKQVSLDANITLDFGGMGKGFGVDKVMQNFKNKHIKKAIIGVSGDIRCLDTCRINIQNPHDANYLAHFDTVAFETGISTSGTYNRYVNSVKNNHLINPKTRFSQQNFTSITLISQLPNSDLDAYATAVSVMPKEKAYQFLNNKSIGYIILENDKKLVISQNIHKFVKNLKVY